MGRYSSFFRASKSFSSIIFNNSSILTRRSFDEIFSHNSQINQKRLFSGAKRLYSELTSKDSRVLVAKIPKIISKDIKDFAQERLYLYSDGVSLPFKQDLIVEAGEILEDRIDYSSECIDIKSKMMSFCEQEIDFLVFSDLPRNNIKQNINIISPDHLSGFSRINAQDFFYPYLEQILLINSLNHIMGYSPLKATNDKYAVFKPISRFNSNSTQYPHIDDLQISGLKTSKIQAINILCIDPGSELVKTYMMKAEDIVKNLDSKTIAILKEKIFFFRTQINDDKTFNEEDLFSIIAIKNDKIKLSYDAEFSSFIYFDLEKSQFQKGEIELALNNLYSNLKYMLKIGDFQSYQLQKNESLILRHYAGLHGRISFDKHDETKPILYQSGDGISMKMFDKEKKYKKREILILPHEINEDKTKSDIFYSKTEESDNKDNNVQAIRDSVNIFESPISDDFLDSFSPIKKSSSAQDYSEIEKKFYALLKIQEQKEIDLNDKTDINLPNKKISTTTKDSEPLLKTDSKINLK